MNVRSAPLVLRFATALVAAQFLGCSGSRHADERSTVAVDIAPGALLIDILEAAHPEHYWQYKVQPSTSTVQVVKETTFADYTHRDLPPSFQQPAGAIGACAENPKLIAVSSNGTLSARCRTIKDSDELEIDSVGGSELRKWKPKGRGFRGFAWSPNSRSVAILNVSSYVGMKPRELLAAFSGHPVPHDQIFLDIFDLQTGQTTEFTIRANVVSSFTRILNWSK
jgi:hypothetical protein